VGVPGCGRDGTRLHEQPVPGRGRRGQGALPVAARFAEDPRSRRRLQHARARHHGERLRDPARVPLPEAALHPDPRSRDAGAHGPHASRWARLLLVPSARRHALPGRPDLRAGRRRAHHTRDRRGRRGLRAPAHRGPGRHESGRHHVRPHRRLRRLLAPPRVAARVRSLLRGAAHRPSVRRRRRDRRRPRARRPRARDRPLRSVSAAALLVRDALHRTGAVGGGRALRRGGGPRLLPGPPDQHRSLPDRSLRQGEPDRARAQRELVRDAAPAVARTGGRLPGRRRARRRRTRPARPCLYGPCAALPRARRVPPGTTPPA
jgi:hypothetical protein